MLTTKDINNRLNWLHDTIAMYETEYNALLSLQKLYDRPEYQILTSIEEPPKPTIISAYSTSAKAPAATDPRQNAATDELMAKINKRQLLKSEILKMTFKEVPLKIDGPSAKALGMSTTTLSNLIGSLKARGILNKTKLHRKPYYRVDKSFIDYVRTQLPVGGN